MKRSANARVVILDRVPNGQAQGGMRQPSSSYATSPQRAATEERAARERHTAQRLARQRRAEDALAISSARAIAAYRREKARAAQQGKPTLVRMEEFRGVTG
jgi:hypothetical protein